MSYCTEQDLTDRYGTERIAELTRDATGQSVNSTLATDAIEEISAKMDAAIRVVDSPANYDATNEILNGLAIEGAYLLLVKWSEGGWTDGDLEEWKMIVKDLESISAGRILLKDETDEQKEDRLEGFFTSNKKLYGRRKTSLIDMGWGEC